MTTTSTVNGKGLDDFLKDMEAKNALKWTDSDKYCRYVVQLVYAMRNTRYTDGSSRSYKENDRTYGKYITISGNYDFQRLEKDVDKNECNGFSVTYASQFYQVVYEYYNSFLFDLVQSFNQEILGEIEEYEKEQKKLKRTDNILKILVIVCTLLLTASLFIDQFPRPIQILAGLLIAGAGYLDKAFDFSEKNINLFFIAYAMRDQYNLYIHGIKPYNLPRGTALDLFRSNIYQLRQRKNNLALTFEKNSKEQIQNLVKDANSLQKMRQNKTR